MTDNASADHTPTTPAPTELNLIVAMTPTGGIGLRGDIPWKGTAYGKKDMEWFKKTTAGCAVIMGRRTYESIPARFRPLPGRINIVLSSAHPNADYRKPDPARVVQLNSLDAAMRYLNDNNVPKVFVCGGAALYTETMSRPDLIRAYVTIVPYTGPVDTTISPHFPSHAENIITATAEDPNAYIVYSYLPGSPLHPRVRVCFLPD